MNVPNSKVCITVTVKTLYLGKKLVQNLIERHGESDTVRWFEKFSASFS